MSTQAIEETRSDAELISAVREGDLDAYGDLFDRHFTRPSDWPVNWSRRATLTTSSPTRS